MDPAQVDMTVGRELALNSAKRLVIVDDEIVRGGFGDRDRHIEAHRSE
jgi:hypothetical protein